MNSKWKNTFVLSLSALLLISCSQITKNTSSLKKNSVKITVNTTYSPDPQMAEKVKEMKKSKTEGKPLYEVYKNLPVIDVHNHQAPFMRSDEYKQYGIDRTVLFGNVSEPAAQTSDQQAWSDYQEQPGLVYPSFAGVNIYNKSGLSYTKAKLEQGYLAIGELVAASTYSQIVSNVEWKGKDPTSGNLGEVYELAAKYHVPVLLHIDPPSGAPIAGLEKALTDHPNTKIIFGHANVYNKPENIEKLLVKYPNLYIDFYAGFTEFDPGSNLKLQDYIPLLEKYPDRFVFGTDSGAGITYEQAVTAIYDTIDLLTPETAVKIAYQNYQRIIEEEPPTKEQIKKIQELSARLGKTGTVKLNKRMANELIFKLEKEVHSKKK